MKDLSHRRKCKYCVCKTRLEIATSTNFFGFVTKTDYVTCESAMCLLCEGKNTIFFMTHLLEFADNFFCVNLQC